MQYAKIKFHQTKLIIAVAEKQIKKLEHKKSEVGQYNLIIEKIEDWPIYKISQQREALVEELIALTKQSILTKTNNDLQVLHLEIAKTLYAEKIRMKNNPWKVDKNTPKGHIHEKKFWDNINEAIVESSLKQPHSGQKKDDYGLLDKILHRYCHEIPGNFNPKSYKFASKVITLGFARLLNTASGPIWTNQFKIRDRIKLTGSIEKIRELATKGTIVLVPTHHSNLDSVLIGWALYTMGLPAFLYGAGLNLFNSSTFGYFMNRLGAYKVDRRKRNLFYLEALKMYSRLTLRKGCHSLFFPGGTRSRSGQLETRLKLGLLGTVIDAQRLNFIEAEAKGEVPKKIFIVPLVINYHFVLEANGLIEHFLKRTGKEKYYTWNSEFPNTTKFTNFVWKFFSSKSEAILSFSDPIDIFGNKVDNNGNSLNNNNQPVNISDYFKTMGKFVEDEQRDSEYTRLLSKAIVNKYYQANTVLSSHLVAFVAFELLARKYHKRLDLYGLLRLPEEECIIPYQQFAPMVEKLRDELRKREEDGSIKLATHMYGDIHRLIKHGLYNLGVYHTEEPLKHEGDNIVSESMKLLYFYRNRLMGYELEKMI